MGCGASLAPGRETDCTPDTAASASPAATSNTAALATVNADPVPKAVASAVPGPTPDAPASASPVVDDGSAAVPQGFQGKLIPTFLICGGGNGGHAFAGAVAHRGVRVHVYTRNPDKWLESGPSITCYYAVDGSKTIARPALITSDPKIATVGADIALLCLPTSCHEDVLKAIGPHLKEGAAIGTVEGAWWGRPPLGDGVLDHLTFFGIDTLPWVARTREYGKSVDIMGTKEVWVACSPADRKAQLVSTLTDIVGVKFTEGSNLLSLFALDLSLIIHPGLMFGQCSRWGGEPFDEAPLFYHGMDEHTAYVMQNMDSEACGIKAELLSRYPDLDLSDSVPTLEWLQDAYGDEIADKSSFCSSFTTNASYAGLTFPVKDAPTAPGKKVYQFDYRYLTADVPYGLIVIKGIAELLGLATPTIDAAIVWAQEMVGKEWLVDGRIAGADLQETRAPQKYGFTTLQEFMDDATK